MKSLEISGFVFSLCLIKAKKSCFQVKSAWGIPAYRSIGRSTAVSPSRWEKSKPIEVFVSFSIKITEPFGLVVSSSSFLKETNCLWMFAQLLMLTKEPDRDLYQPDGRHATSFSFFFHFFFSTTPKGRFLKGRKDVTWHGWMRLFKFVRWW